MAVTNPTMYCLNCGYVLDGLIGSRCPECGRPFDPGDAGSFRAPGQPRHPETRLEAFLRHARWVTVPLVATWVWFRVVDVRTWGFGSIRCLAADVAAAAMFGLGPAVLVWAGARWRRFLLGVVATLVIPAMLAEGFATLEEQLFLRQARRAPLGTPTIFKDRWWPNGGSYLYYNPATGRYGGGD